MRPKIAFIVKVLAHPSRKRIQSRVSTLQRVCIFMVGINYKVKIASNQTVLDGLREAELEPPYSCQSGVCGACRAKLIKGTVAMKVRMALDDDDDVSEAAQAWMQRFDDARDRPAQTGYSDSPQASNADVRGAFHKAIKTLLTKELLELEDGPGLRGELVDELTESFFRTVSLVERGAEMDRAQIIRRLVDTMIDSDAVVDVYGDDATLEQVFRIAMGA